MTSNSQQLEYSLESSNWGYHSLWLNNFHVFAYHLHNSCVSIKMNLWVDQCLLYMVWIEWGPVRSPVTPHMRQDFLRTTQFVDKRSVIYRWGAIWTKEACHRMPPRRSFTSCEAICHDQRDWRSPKDPAVIAAHIFHLPISLTLSVNTLRTAASVEWPFL